MSSSKIIKILITLFFLLNTSIFSQNQVIPGNVRIDATLHHISILWEISGDNNHNSTFSTEYRPLSGGNWLFGALTMRAYPELIVNGSALGMNYHAGSIMFLEESELYEIKLILTDADGGGETRIFNVATKTELEPSPTGADKYVIPGNGGGAGTVSDPYKGLQEAADNADPGDIFHVSEGIYDTFRIITSGTCNSPIVFQGPENDTAFINGGSTNRGIITIGNSSDSCGYIIIENFVIQDGNWGIDAQNTHNILFKKNIVRNVNWGYCNRRENGWEHDQMLTDNIFRGSTSWPGTGIPPERGVDIHGNNNVICYNEIMYFGDGISTDITPYCLSYSMDIHNNDISFCVDDPIEVDGTVANTRVFRNRVSNSRMGISLAPIFGGPCYIFRNEFFNIDYSIYKMNREPSGLIIVHNTACKLGIGTTSDAGWQNTYLRNNILLSTEYIFEEYDLISGSLLDDWDFDALGSERAGTSGEPWFKWDNIRYANLNELQTGANIELHGLTIGFLDLVNAVLPSNYSNGVVPGNYDLSLVSTSSAVDTGEILSNINKPFVLDNKPDCGAFEYGQPLPHYGPRFGNTAIEEGSLIENSKFSFSIKPNPFNLSCIISISGIPVSDYLDKNIFILDLAGRIIDKILGIVEINGDYKKICWQWIPDENILNGFYFAQINNYDFNKKIILIR